jgi:RNA polymerase sigma-70 factor (ECF subfamily)
MLEPDLLVDNSRRPQGRRPALVSDALVHVDALYRLACYLTGNGTDAEALVQATFARALGGVEDVAGPSIKARLCRTLRDTFVTEWPPPDPADQGVEGVDDTDDDPDPPGADDVQRLRAVALGDLEVALMTLPDDERVVIVLDLEGLSDDELAFALGCPLPSVPSRLARSRAALRRKLAEVHHGAH